MKPATPKQRAYRFFYANAGWSYNPATQTARQGRAATARTLAKAERDARALGYSFEWEYEKYPDEGMLGDHAYWCQQESDGEEHSHELLCCLMRDADGEIVGSLGAIIDPSREYRRVVEAELALEALHSAAKGMVSTEVAR